MHESEQGLSCGWNQGEEEGFEERWNTTLLPAAGAIIVGTSRRHSHVSVYIQTRNDPALYGATVNLYAKSQNAKAIVAVFALAPNAAGSLNCQSFTPAPDDNPCDGYDVEILPTGTPTIPTLCTVIAHGWEGCCGGEGGGGGGANALLLIVSPQGSDVTGDGTDEAPYQTIAHAMLVAKSNPHRSAGQYVQILCWVGTYPENVVLPVFVALTGASADACSVGTGIGPAVTLDPEWTTTSSPAASIEGFLIDGVVDADFTGVATTGFLVIGPNASCLGLTAIGDAVGGGFVDLFNSDVAAFASFTGITLFSQNSTFIGVDVASTAAQPFAWDSTTDAIIGALSIDASAGSNASVTSRGTSLQGELTKIDGGGGVASYRATAEGIPEAGITLIGGSAEPTKDTGLRALNNDGQPDGYVATLVGGIGTWAPNSAAVTWADDLAGSTNVDQWVASISGSGGTGGAVPLTGPTELTSEAGAQTGIDLSLADPAFGFIVGNFLIANNIVDAKLAGALEVGPLTATSIVLAQGAYTFLPSGEMQVAATVTWLMDQANTAAVVQGADVHLAPQTCSHAVDNGGGSFFVDLQAPAGAGAEALFGITRANVARFVVSVLPGFPTIEALWLGNPPTIDVAHANLWSDGTTTRLGGSLAVETVVGGAVALYVNPAVVEMQTGWQHAVPDGSIGAPSYSFTSQLATGFYRDAASTEIRASVANAFVAAFLATGGIGIPLLSVPALSSAESQLFVLNDSVLASNGCGMTVKSRTSGGLTTIAAGGASANWFDDIAEGEAVAVAGGGGTAAVLYPLPSGFAGKVIVTCVSSEGNAAGCFSQESTATVRVPTATGFAAFGAAVALSANPQPNPNLDKVSDTPYNSGGGVPSDMALSVTGADANLVATITNNGALAHTFAIFFECLAYGG